MGSNQHSSIIIVGCLDVSFPEYYDCHRQQKKQHQKQQPKLKSHAMNRINIIAIIMAKRKVCMLASSICADSPPSEGAVWVVSFSTVVSVTVSTVSSVIIVVSVFSIKGLTSATGGDSR